MPEEKQKVNLPLSWLKYFNQEFEKDYIAKLRNFLQQEISRFEVYPPMKDVFNALHFCLPENLKVVILGQDPYHGPKQAHGLCFSVLEGIAIPPSLENIFQELKNDVDFVPPGHGCLTDWAKQGVMLLNNVLTVRRGQAQSHINQGWEQLTDFMVEIFNESFTDLVFMLWGSAAQKKGCVIDQQKHLILKAPHPSPLSAHRGFLGCRHFSKCNEYLKQKNKLPINWQI